MNKIITSLYIIVFIPHFFGQFDRPHAPEVTINYQQNPTPGFSFHLSNPQISNNYLESYSAFGWYFQGYFVFQLLNDTITLQDSFSPEYYRLVKILDIADTVEHVNLNWTGCNSELITLPNSGTSPDFLITQDAFSNSSVVENQTYCFRIFSFATNENALDPNCNNSNYALIGQLNPNTGGPSQILCVVASTANLNTQHLFEPILIGPNPTDGIVHFTEINPKSPLKIVVYNELGQLVYENFIQSSTHSFELPSTGVFTIRLEQDGQRCYRKLIRL